ncbi:hypothetical protein [Streptomyces lydicus]|uniref:hypothetical protein n=1 Tax=Streptomyces lydicus TaxID=47763 RepID=UPI001010F448|nr:hypothetical protein [Streptomyces lydicus]
MSALNVDFSDEDLQALREIAKECGVSMKDLVRSAASDTIARHRALKAGAQEFQRVFHDPDLSAAIAAAGIDDGPATGRKEKAA